MIEGRFTPQLKGVSRPNRREAIAVGEGLNKTLFFILGCPNLTVVVDHKPLLKILGDRTLEDIPSTRLRNLK